MRTPWSGAHDGARPVPPEARHARLYCPRHGQTVPLDPGRITRLVNLGDGLIVVEASCYDGQRIVTITGSLAVLRPDDVGNRPRAGP